MAETPVYKWRLPEGTDQPVVHVDMAELAGDIEATVSQSMQIMPGFPKQCGAPGTNISGWRGDSLYVTKYKVREGLFRYEFNGYLTRASSITVAAGAAQFSVANFLPEDVTPGGVFPAAFFVAPLQGLGGLAATLQALFSGRDFQYRASSTTSVITSPASGSATPASMGLAFSGYTAYGVS